MVHEEIEMKRRTAFAAFLGSLALCLSLLTAAARAAQPKQEPYKQNQYELQSNISLSPKESLFSSETMRIPGTSDRTDNVEDAANLFTAEEILKMDEISQRIKDKFGLDTFILTWDAADTASSADSDNFARDLVRQYGEEIFPDGYLAFCIHMVDRSFFIDAYGEKAVEEFPVSVTENLAENAQDRLVEGEYGKAAIDFLEETEKRLEIISTPLGFLKKPLLYPAAAAATFGLTLVIAGGLAFLFTYLRAKKHEDKKISLTASQYGENFALSDSRDTFFRHYQTRTPRPKEHSSGGGGGISSSVGGGHSGSGGHF